MKIAFYISGFDGCGYYRVQLVAKYLNRIEGVHAKIFSQYSKGDIRWADIIVLQKQSNQKALDFVRYGKSHGKKIVTEVDDDFFNIPVWNPAYKHYLGKGQDLINFYALSDAITVTTPHLGKQLSKYNSNTIVLPNSLDIPVLNKFDSMEEGKLLKYTQYLDSSKNKISLEKASSLMDGKTIIGWGGSPTHFKDLEQVSEALIQLCKDNRDVVINMAGSCIDKLMSSVSPEQLILVGAVPIFRYLQTVSSLRWDIGICPIEDNLFNRSKSNLKYLEFAQRGYACACSNVGNYSKTVNNGVNGLLTNNTPEEWYSCLSELAVNTSKRSTISAKGIELVEENYNIEKNITLWHKAYREILEK